MSKRLLSWAGSLLLVIGVGAVIGTGYSYFTSSHHNLGPAPVVIHPGKGVNYQNNHLLASAQKTTAVAGANGIRIRIPAINVDSPLIETSVVKGTWQVADWAVGHLEGTAQPGQVGNMALAAHDDIKGEIFKRIGSLKTGDKIFVSTSATTYVYKVSGQQTVSPYDGSGVLATHGNARMLTMITCTPYWVDTSRLIVTANLASHKGGSASTF